MVPATVRYRKAGVRPPVFVAGSFSNPEWVPREMDWVLDDRGESLFTMEIHVEENREYQYKFKVGHGDDWDLDEQSPTTSDSMGNLNNLLTVTSTSFHGTDLQLPAAGDANYSPQITPSEPAKPVLSEDARPARKNKKKRAGKPAPIRLMGDAPRVVTPTDDTDEAAVPSTPLFAHECLGAYDFEVVDDGFDHSLSPSATRTMSISSFGALAPDYTSPDVDDPTLEKFPCDKSSVMNTLRRISTSMGEGPIQLADRPSSPQFASRRDSVDTATDSLPSPDSLSPTSSKKRDSRPSHSSFGRTKSAVSLGSIVEEPPRAPGTSMPGDKASDKYDDAIGSTSEDDGPQLKDHKVYTARYAKENHDPQASSVALSPKTQDKTPPRSSKPTRQFSWPGDGDSCIEGRWFITGGFILLALGITWWKSCRD